MNRNLSTSWFPEEQRLEIRTWQRIAAGYDETSLGIFGVNTLQIAVLTNPKERSLSVYRHVGSPVEHGITFPLDLDKIEQAKNFFSERLAELEEKTRLFMTTAAFEEWTYFQLAQAAAYTNRQSRNTLLCKGGTPGLFIIEKTGTSPGVTKAVNKVLRAVNTPDCAVPIAMSVPLPSSARDKLAVEAIQKRLNLR